MTRLLAISLVLLGVAAGAQAPEYDVVSIKPYSGPLPPQVNITAFTYLPQGGLRGSPATAMGLITSAYRTDGITRPEQIVGLPAWAEWTRFEIVGTVDHTVSRDVLNAQLPGMLRRVLEERFKLAAHMEKRPIALYALVFARADGRLGSAVKESTVDCAVAEKQVQEMLKTVGPAEMAARARASGSPMGCGTGGGGAAGHLVGHGTALSVLTSALGVDRPVIDKTGLAGRYDFELTWSPQAPAAGTQPGAPAIFEGPSVFTALQEQLGLKLEARDEPMDSLVVDHIEPPTPN